MKLLPAILFLNLVAGLSAQNDADDFRTVSRYYSDTIGSRLVVRPETQQGVFARDLELRIEDETFYDLETSEFREREIATIQGGGMGNLGLRFYTQQMRSQEEFIQVLEDFQDKIKAFQRYRSDMQRLEEKWMGDGGRALSESRVVTEIQTDFFDRPSVVSLNWDLKNDRLWLSLDDFINIDRSIAVPLTRLIERIPEYSRQRREFRKAIAEKNEWVDKTLALPVHSEDQPTADRVDTPTVISEEHEESQKSEEE